MSYIQNVIESPVDDKEIETWLKNECMPKPSYNRPLKQKSTQIMYYNLETAGLSKDADVLQVSFIGAESNDQTTLSMYILPK